MAAAVLVSPSLHTQFFGGSMAASTRRQPLMSIPNATNSPHRALSNSGSKRSRALANGSYQENEPPSKRLAVEKSSREPVPITPRRQAHEAAEGKVFERGTGTPLNSFQKRLVAARDRGTTSRTTRNNTTTGAGSKDVDTIRQWQRHYRKLFPTFHIFFDSITEETKTRFIKQIRSLGAREEQFFSNHVTHIVTSRPLPDAEVASKSLDTTSKTVNPSMLDLKNGRSKKDSDVLVRGLQMGMKVWTAEKLQKMLSTLFDGKAGPEPNQSRANGYAATELVEALKNEKLAAAAAKQHAGMPRDYVLFKGPFIYVHDMNEKWKPTMIREYAKVAHRSDGDWPQFRSAAMGKCPFVEDPAMKRELERERAQQHALQLSKAREAERRNQSQKAAVEASKMNPPRRTSPRKILRETHANTVSTTQQAISKPAQIPQPERQSSFPPMPEQPPVAFINPGQMLLAREPAASGIQKSAMTSAIQSQMISSAAATGIKGSTSKEVNELKRKVLERTHTGSLSLGSISSSHQVNALIRNTRAPAPQRAAKSRAQEKLGGIQEEADPYADDVEAQRQLQAASRKKKMAQRDPKPGYCENCHDKYDDFEDHILSRKHRKFATTASNWTDLDALLAKLQEA